MVDTQSQYLKIKAEVDEAVLQVMQSSQFIGGPVVDGFARNLATYLGTDHVIPCANGTDALQIALMALDIKPGDEIICPSFTYIATVEVAALLGITVVFVDVEKDSFCIDPLLIEAAITARTKAIIPVHLYGQAANMESIMAVAVKHNLYVIEDNAQAIGNTYTFSNGTSKKTGTIGHIGCTSFYPSKNLGAFGDGGAMCTDDERLARKLKMIASHGQERRYYHDVVGCNSRLDAMQAAILNIKLTYLDEYNTARKNAADFYDTAFAACKNLVAPVRMDYNNHVFHQYTLTVLDDSRDALYDFLQSEKIPCMIYYPVPAHRQKMFEAYKSADTVLPITDWLTERVISLPIHTELDQEQLRYITQKVLSFFS